MSSVLIRRKPASATDDCLGQQGKPRRIEMKAAIRFATLAFLFAAGTVLVAVALQKQPNPNTNPNGNPTVPPQGKLPDITDAAQGIIIGGAVGGVGGKFVPWGTTADLSDVAPLPGTTVNGKCAFNATYKQRNIGGVQTNPLYVNKLKLEGPAEVAINSGQHLNPGETKSVTTQPYLTEGEHALMLYLDDGNAVAESNEGNNFYSIKYRLKCNGQPGNPTGGKLPDITDARKGIIIGGAVGGAGGLFVPWGTVADLSGVDPLPGTIVEGRCAFNATYAEINTGSVATSPNYTNKLKLDGATDVAINTARHLNAGETKSVTTQPYLATGAHGLQLALDDGNVVPESNESNNVFSIRYTLKECKKPGGNPNGMPDLIAVLTNPMTGQVAVKNIGTGPAGPSKLVLDCHKQGHIGGGGGCAELPATVASTYSDPAFPDKVTINVPNLAPGAAYTHTLSFWGSLKWTSGKYDFKALADAANTVAESNEANNTATSILIVP